MRQDQEAGARVAGGLRKSLVKVKKEKKEQEEEVKYEMNQIRATNSLPTKVDELKTLALAAGADASDVQVILNCPLQGETSRER